MKRFLSGAHARLWFVLLLLVLLLPAAKPALGQVSSFTLLNNAAASGALTSVDPGNYLLFIKGTFSGATLTLTETIDGTGYTLGTYTAAPAIGALPCIVVPRGAQLQMTVAGGPPSGIFATLGGTGAGGCLNQSANSISPNIFPLGATPISASATGTTAATTATLAAAPGKTTYICGMAIRANATAAATGDATVTGTITGTLHFTQWTAPLASGIGLVEQNFSHCVPANAVNTGIAVISAAPGSGGVVSVSAWGFQL